jgi:hypothetical protein
MRKCCVCAAAIWQQLKQWHNRDTGWSICRECVMRYRPTMHGEEFEQLYGEEGVHYPGPTIHCDNCGNSKADTERQGAYLGVQDPICCEVNGVRYQ